MLGDIVLEMAAALPQLDLDETAGFRYGAKYQVIDIKGRLVKPDGGWPEVRENMTRLELSQALQSMFGEEFGVPEHVAVLPGTASLLPESGHGDPMGWNDEEGIEEPNKALMRKWGLADDEVTSLTGRAILLACRNFTELVVKPLNRGLPAGTHLPQNAGSPRITMGPIAAVGPTAPRAILGGGSSVSGPSATTIVDDSADRYVHALVAAFERRNWKESLEGMLSLRILVESGTELHRLRALMYRKSFDAIMALAKKRMIAEDGTLKAGR